MTGELRIDVTYDPRVYFAMQQNSVPVVPLLRLSNTGSEPLLDLEVEVRTLPELAAPWTRRIAAVPAASTYNLADVDLQLRADLLVGVTERTHGSLLVRVRRAGELLAEQQLPLDVLAYNEWPGAGSLPAVLAAFVLPNHPELAPVLRDAAAELLAATGSSALDGYQSRDPERARALAAALWQALQRRQLVYVSPPPSFEQHGQRVRTPEQVLGERLGTCLDLATLYAAACEACGLQPLVVVLREHALAGVWLQPGSGGEAALGDALELLKRVELGSMAVVECTALCGAPVPFPRACEQAVRRLGSDEFVFAVDVAAARAAGMRPLPLRSASYAAVAELPLPAAAAAATAPAAVVAATPVAAPPPPEPEDRLSRWKRRLLDLSLRNRLLNCRRTRTSVALLCPDLPALEDALASGRAFTLLGRPRFGGDDDPRDLERRQQQSGEDVLADWLRGELQQGRLHCDHDDGELADRLTAVFRAARTSLEETGANTLYLACGFLRWFETPHSQQERLAPLLLLPLRLERLSMAEGFRVAVADEDPQLNHTLLQKLERDFGLRLPALAALPEDAHGADVAAVLQQFRAAVVERKGWQVLPQASIGLFSFTKHLMWLDLEERSALLRQNPLVQHLLDTPAASFVQPGAPPDERELDRLPADALLCPKDADASQLRAVVAAQAGRSFVLEGPPGTGKSQTITNVIAQALADGKRVLFVAEKRAALEVVQRRLSDVGLGPFCLELHSHKGSKLAVVQQLAAVLELGHEREPAAFAARARELDELRQRLNRHVDALHRQRRIGRSVHQVVGQLVAQAADPYVAGLPIDLDQDGLQQRRAAVAALQHSALDLGVPPALHRWHGSRRSDWHPALLRELPPQLQELQQAVAALAAATAPLAARFGLDAGAFGRAQLPALDELAALLPAGPLPAELLLAADFAARQARLRELCGIGRERDRLRADLEARWLPQFLALDLPQLRLQFQLHGQRMLLLRWWRLRPVKAQLRAACRQRPLPGDAALIADLDAALALAQRQQQLDRGAAEAAAWLGAAWRSGEADWAAIEQLLQRCERARGLAELLAAGEPGRRDELRRRLAALAPAELPERPPFAAALAGFAAALAPLQARLPLDLDAAFGAPAAPGALAAIAARVAGWVEQPAALREHTAFRRDADAAVALGLAPLLAAMLDGELEAAQLVAAFERSFADDWLAELLRQEPELARFRGLDHERCIAQFRRLDRELLGLAAKVVRARLCAQLPSLRSTSAESSELGLLLREIKKQRRHLPVRQLLQRLPNLLPRLSPCLLMSPLSVAQFLGGASLPADLVVFDEASQIPVWDAVGALGRGHTAIVVGDSRQLPPTTFFQRQDGGDDDEPLDDAVVEELESVLDECNAAGLERLHLRWHYRSRHESLIAFSNHHYYDNRLLTFPSPDLQRAAPQHTEPQQSEPQHPEPQGSTQQVGDPRRLYRQPEGRGVQLCHVDGVYDRAGSQQNRIEAEALVSEVLARLGDPQRRPQSLGIVTFSAAQQQLIEDLLDRARQQDPALDRFFTGVDEPVFVKNLENVQGDERDVVLFSIGYGPDAAGRVWVNFGPLNQRGGERRLNVAITRARSELLVFSSLRPDQIDLRRVQSVGARHLLTFLDYAARGPAAIAEAIALDPRAAAESPFEAAVRDALRQRGWELHEQVGCSGYRVDLAVVDPRAPGRYLLGIECDGATYHAAATARDRDRLRQAVLEGLGWRLARVWSTDWWQDRAGELQRLEAALQQALRQPRDEPQPVPPRVATVPAGEAAARVADEPAAHGADGAGAEAEPAADDPEVGDGRGDAETGGKGGGETGGGADGTAAAEGMAGAAAAAAGADTAAAPGPVLPVYSACTLPRAGDAEAFHAPQHRRQILDQCRAVLAAEAPLTFDLLCRRIAAAWDIGRVTDRVREHVRRTLAPGGGIDDVLWRPDQDAGTWTGFRTSPAGEAARDADQLPVVETANAMAWLLSQHAALAVDDLLREAARLFGITRLGASVRAAMQAGLQHLQARGGCAVDGGQVRLP